MCRVPRMRRREEVEKKTGEIETENETTMDGLNR
jgi:hypothetical protein